MLRQNKHDTAEKRVTVRAPLQMEPSDIANGVRVRVQVMDWEVVSGSLTIQRDMKRYDACLLPATSQSPTRLAFLF
jgi:hypothetical protein